MSLAEKIIGGSGLLIAVYLIVTNPHGTSTALNSISGVFNSGAKTLQGR